MSTYNQTRCRVIERLTSGVVFKIKQKRSLLNIIFISSSGLPEEKKTRDHQNGLEVFFSDVFSLQLTTEIAFLSHSIL